MIREVNVLIARRIPPGDRWTLGDDADKNVIDGLTETLNRYHVITGFTGSYRLSPLTGELFAIQEKEEKEKIKKYNIYGE